MCEDSDVVKALWEDSGLSLALREFRKEPGVGEGSAELVTARLG